LSLKGEDLSIFTHLGLTPRQAEVYLTICKLEKATVKTIAKKLQIARAEIYRAIPSLEKLGLIERIITTPTAFRAIPLADGLSILLQRDVQKHKEIQAEADVFVKTFKQNNVKESNQEEEELALISQGGYSPDFEKRLNNLQTSLDGIAIWHYLRGHCLDYRESFKRAIERGVKMRHITHIPKGEVIPEVFCALKDMSSFDVKFVSAPPPTSFAIFDKKEVGIVTSHKGLTSECTILLSNNPNLVKIFQDYFELKWRLTLETEKIFNQRHLTNRKSSSCGQKIFRERKKSLKTLSA